MSKTGEKMMLMDDPCHENSCLYAKLAGGYAVERLLALGDTLELLLMTGSRAGSVGARTGIETGIVFGAVAT